MDYYDKAVEYLRKRPEEIYDAWCSPKTHVCGRLFAFVHPEASSCTRPDGTPCGCLTMIRGCPETYVAWTTELTAAILADNAIPDDVEEITVDTLPIFPPWQRRIDAELGRTPPVWPEGVEV